MITTLLADDHVVFRHGVRKLLEKAGFLVVAEASDGPEAVDLVKQLRPQVAILDLGMPLLNGIDATHEIVKTTGGNTKVILLTMYSESAYVMSAIAAGVNGYVLKSRAPASLIEAIHEVHRGNTYLSPEISRSGIETMKTDSAP